MSKRGSVFHRVRLLLSLWVLAFSVSTHAADSWPEALRVMPLAEPAREINETNFATLMLNSFQSNNVVKGIVLMPGATDEFYFFHRATTKLAPTDDNLLAAITALTNHTRIRVMVRLPLLLLYTPEDQLEPKITVKSPEMVARLKVTPYLPHVIYNDRDWDYLRPYLLKQLDGTFWPPQESRESWHFYRHSFAAWNLSGWEALEAIAMSGKTTFTVEKTFFKGRPKVTYEPDTRIKTAP